MTAIECAPGAGWGPCPPVRLSKEADTGTPEAMEGASQAPNERQAAGHIGDSCVLVLGSGVQDAGTTVSRARRSPQARPLPGVGVRGAVLGTPVPCPLLVI